MSSVKYHPHFRVLPALIGFGSTFVGLRCTHSFLFGALALALSPESTWPRRWPASNTAAMLTFSSVKTGMQGAKTSARIPLQPHAINSQSFPHLTEAWTCGVNP